MASRFNLTDEFLAMTFPDEYYKSVIEPAKLGKGPIPSKTEMLLKSQPFKAVTLPAREALNPGSIGAFRASGTPVTRFITQPIKALLSAPAAGILTALESTPANADEVNMTAEDFAALARKEGMTLGAPKTIAEQIVSDVNKPGGFISTAEAATADPDMIPSQDIGTAPQVFDIDQLGDPALNPGSVNAMGVNPFDVNENLIDRGNPFGDPRVVSEEMGLTGGIPDRGRGMAGPAVEMIGGRAVPVGDVLGRQMALEKADFFDAPKSKFGIGELLSIAGLLTQARPIQALSMIANREKIGRGIGKAKSGIGSLNRKLRGVNPDGTTRTQAQFEAAREQRRRDKRVANMLERKAAGKSYSQKNLNELTTGGSKPGTYTAKGAGSGGTSSKIVCTMMNERYGFGSFRNKIWMKFHESYGPEYQKGYHAIFLPLVKIAKGEGKINTAVRKVLEHMGRHVTADMFKIMKGKKRDTLGRIYRAIFEPTCRIIGKIKSAPGRG